MPRSHLICRTVSGASWTMRCIVVALVTGGWCVLAAMLALGAEAAVPQSSASLSSPALLTNLFQLRELADQEPAVVHPFRIVAEVCEVDPDCGVLVLRDASDVEFIRVDLPDRNLERGAMVRLEGDGCAFRPFGFGLVLVPRLAVANDGIHGGKLESAQVFLHDGMNPFAVQWFNANGDCLLIADYEGPGLSRTRIPASAFFRATLNPSTGATNFSAGLDYRCYEGNWEYLPDFASLRAVKTGTVTNLDLGVRTRPEMVGLEFSGFLNIPRDGLYTFHVVSDDGCKLFVGESSVHVAVLSNPPAPAAIDKVPAAASDRRPWATLDGTINFVGARGAGGELQMRVGNDDIRADVFEGGKVVPNVPLHAKVRVSGIYEDVVAEDGSRVPGVLLVPSWKFVHTLSSNETMLIETATTGRSKAAAAAPARTQTPTISTVAEIKALSPEMAARELPVSIRGVVTAILPGVGGAVVQDSTRGIFIFLTDIKESEPLRRGEFCQIDGVTTPGLFAPSIQARRITHLGAGQFPQPARATWDQLVNGSLDTQYAEMDGVITAVNDQTADLVTEGGKVTLFLNDFQTDTLAGYENALVRLRGCVFARFNEQTHKLEPGSLRLGGAAVEVLQPAPRDLFDVPRKSIAELLLYDPKATPLRMLKVSGQVVYGGAGQYFLTDGTNGLHVTTRKPDHFVVGDLVDAVGFLQLGGPAAELSEAFMRKTGSAPLPAPTRLASDGLLLASHAGTLVQLEATLMNQWRDGADYMLEMQSGFLAFRARIDSHGVATPMPPSGSRLELTGVFAAQGNHPVDGNVNGFELLLHSVAGMRVLARPPWWTLKRVLYLAGMLAVVLCGVLAWNRQLQRQVEERSHQLETEIRNRERAEQQRAAEAERSRIARDLHDELGAGLTEVSLLASAGLGESRAVEKDNDRFRTIADKARDLVSGLDVIVWAVDPRRNSLQSFADYVGSYAKELLSASEIVCRLKIPIECNAVTLTGTARHSVLLAIKEALNNIIRHAAATEVELQISQTGDRLQIVIADNGRGIDWKTIRRGSGLQNLNDRLEALHGQCEIESQSGKGTTIRLTVPVPGNGAG